MNEVFGFGAGDVNRIRRAVRLADALGGPSFGGGADARFSGPTYETVVVAITGTLSGSGYYTGGILTGKSNAGTGGTNTYSPGNFNFQLQSIGAQTQTDGPAYPNTSNAVIVNLPEQFVGNSHKLLCSGYTHYAVGRFMGITNESTPRAIVYVDDWPVRPVVAKITATQFSTIGGVYTGEIVSGAFAADENSYAFALASIAPRGISGTNDCWITNVYEQTFRVNSGTCQLATGTFVFGLQCGWPIGIPGNANKFYYQVYTWQMIQASAPSTIIGASPTSASMSAGASYTSNEQNMLNRLVADVGNLWAMLGSFYANAKTAGHTL